MASPSQSPVEPAIERAADSNARRLWGKRLLRASLTIAAVGTLGWLLDRIGWAKVLSAFARLGFGGATALVVLGILENTFDATSFHIALKRRIGTLRVLGYSGLGGLVNVLIPWDAGEILKVGLIRRHMRLSDAVAGTVIWNYLCKLSRPLVGTALALLGLVGCPSIPIAIRWAILGASVLSAVPYVAIKWILHRGAVGSVLVLLTKFRLLNRARSENGRPKRWSWMAKFADFHRSDPRAYWEMLTHQILGRVASWAALHVTAHLLGLGYSVPLTALLYAGISVATYVYMLLPSRLGVGEVAGAGVFALLGLPFDAGLLVQLIMRIKGLVTLTLASVLAANQRATKPVVDNTTMLTLDDATKRDDGVSLPKSEHVGT
ncbi:MAG: lysylphosphatidylglycerol synthase transmembrane domain-containing protein [Polyangiaceae bacterium]